MTTTTSQPTTCALVPVTEPLFTVAERQALAEFLAGLQRADPRRTLSDHDAYVVTADPA